MLSPKTQYSLKNAQEYFSEHLSAGDYYATGQTTHGQWLGCGASDLGLNGNVGQAEFLALCENSDPRTGARLTQITKSRRLEMDETGKETTVPNRRVFYDFTISAPKSVSIAGLIGGDVRILEAHQKAVSAATLELETFASTRVRLNKVCSDRDTGSIVAALFTHDTSRALDPHLHTHCIVFNATFDPVEKRWKALQNFEMLRAQKYVENVYYHELARALVGFGYAIENTRRGDFVLKGMPHEMTQRFSKRHEQIEEQTRDLLEKNPDMAAGNLAGLREHIAHSRRARKIKNISSETLQWIWSEQLRPQERELVECLKSAAPNPEAGAGPTAGEALLWAEEHLFERKSVLREHELWRHALEFGRGGPFSVAELKSCSARRDYVRDPLNSRKLTTRIALAREWDILQIAKTGRGLYAPFNASHVSEPALDCEQQKAVQHILRSKDFLTLFRGVAGTGKSFALKEVWRGLLEARHSVQCLAPQRQQAMDLAASGMGSATTIADFMARRPMMGGEIVLVDEAGQIGAGQMRELLRYVLENRGRVICSGDTRQHGAVEASDALRAIERFAGIKPAELTSIRRQNPELAQTATERDFIRQYREAVAEASRGMSAESFQRLDRLGAIQDCSGGSQQVALAGAYVDFARREQSVLVVAQTWSETGGLNEEIRRTLREAGILGRDEIAIRALNAIDLTKAQRCDTRSYQAGQILLFNRDLRGFRRDERATVLAVNPKSITVGSASRVVKIPVSNLARTTLCEEREMVISQGDRLQIKANQRLSCGKRLCNGEIVTVAKVTKSGVVTLSDGRILGRDFRRFVRGYAVTSYASQGKTVDYVLFSDSAVRAATNQQQWYVSISRGRKGIRIFTSDKEALHENNCRSGENELALDLASPSKGDGIRKKGRLRVLIKGAVQKIAQQTQDLGARISKRVRSI